MTQRSPDFDSLAAPSSPSRPSSGRSSVIRLTRIASAARSASDTGSVADVFVSNPWIWPYRAISSAPAARAPRIARSSSAAVSTWVFVICSSCMQGRVGGTGLPAGKGDGQPVTFRRTAVRARVGDGGRIDRGQPEQTPRFIGSADSHRQRGTGPAHPDRDFAAGPIGYRRNGPVRQLHGDHRGCLQRTVRKLDTRFGPTCFVDPDEHARLIVELGEIRQERDLNRPAVRQIAEQGVRVVADETVGRCAPCVAAARGLHDQPALGDGHMRWSIEPPALKPWHRPQAVHEAGACHTPMAYAHTARISGLTGRAAAPGAAAMRRLQTGKTYVARAT